MKNKKRIIELIIILAALLVACNHQQKAGFPVLTGPYLGQTPPGTIPEVFAPGIVSTGLYTRDVAISKDEKEIYFSVADDAVTGIFVAKLIGDIWTEPVIAPFSGKEFFDFEPHISPDGNKFFFLSTRPPQGKEPKKGWFYQKIWAMNRTETGWSEPQIVDISANSEDDEYFPSVTNKNVLYFTRSSKGGKPRLYKSEFQNGKYEEPEMLPFDVPENGLLFNAFVSPEEDFLITCAVGIDSTNVDQDYYISFKTNEGKWSKLKKLGTEINTPDDNGSSAFVSRDGKYLFFNSSRKDPNRPQAKSGTSLRTIINSKLLPGNGSSAIYWVDAKVIKELRPKE
jgi:hypothetical protein